MLADILPGGHGPAATDDTQLRGLLLPAQLRGRAAAGERGRGLHDALLHAVPHQTPTSGGGRGPAVPQCGARAPCGEHSGVEV